MDTQKRRDACSPEGSGGQTQSAPCKRYGEQHGLEGIVSKRRDSPYRSGSSRSWVKAKCWVESDLLIIGTEPQTKTGAMRLLLASEEEDGLVFKGKALLRLGPGERDALHAYLKQLELPAPPISGMRMGSVQWVKPQLRVCI